MVMLGISSKMKKSFSMRMKSNIFVSPYKICKKNSKSLRLKLKSKLLKFNKNLNKRNKDYKRYQSSSQIKF